MRSSVALACLLLTAGCEGSPDPIPRGPQAQLRHAVWSPDDLSFAYELEQFADGIAIYTVNIDGSDPKLRVNGGYVPSWSPDGSRLVFASGASIYLYDLATEGISLLPTRGLSMTPSWAPTGDAIALATNNGDSHAPPDLWMISPTGGDMRRMPLPGPPRNQTDSPAWSPNGSHVAAIVRDGFSGGRLFRTDTLGVDTLYLSAGNEAAESPAWHPDGSLIAYSRVVGQSLEIWRVSIDGTDRRRIVRNAVDPAWSHDGTRLAFTRLNSDGPGELWYLTLATGDETLVARP